MSENLPKIFLEQRSLIPWLGKTGKMLSIFMKDNFAEHGFDLTREQFILLAHLHHQDGVKQKDLAFITERNKGSLARLVSTMEKKDFVARITSPDDKRVNLVFLTKNGRKVFEKLQPVINQCMEKAQAGLTDEEIKKAISVLKKIQENISMK